MSTPEQPTVLDYQRRIQLALLGQAGLGLVVWLFLRDSHLMSAISFPLVERLLSLGVLVVAPLVVESGIRGAGPAWPAKLARLVAVTHLPAAACAIGALTLPVGTKSATLVLPWVCQSLLVASLGLRRLGLRGPTPVQELAVDAAHLYLPVGAVWLCASRAGLELMGFGPILVVLTAVHFHFAGLAAPAIVGQIGRLLKEPSRVYQVAAALVAATPILVAVGILGAPLLEVSMAWLLAGSVVLVSGVVFFEVIPQQGGVATALLGASQLVSLYTMALGGRFALGEYQGTQALGIAEMITSHGRWNALGYAVPSLLLLAWLAPPRRDWIDRIPFPVLWAGMWVGEEWFKTSGTEDPDEPVPRGVVPDLDALVGREFPEVKFPEDIRRYYEESQTLDLLCRAHWCFPFGTTGPGFSALMSRIGQLVLPSKGPPQRISHRLFALKSARFPTVSDAVGSYRAYVEQGPMFVILYATHEAAGTGYMNVSLPLPGGAMHSVLRGIPLGGGQGLRLTSRRTADRPEGHEGLWWRIGPLILRLPLHETLDAYPASHPSAVEALGFQAAPAGVMQARHQFEFLGFHCLRLEYVLVAAGTVTDATEGFPS